MTSEQHDYYRKRAAAERKAAADAPDPSIARLHLELAERYEAIVADGFDRMPVSPARPASPDHAP